MENFRPESSDSLGDPGPNNLQRGLDGKKKENYQDWAAERNESSPKENAQKRTTQDTHFNSPISNEIPSGPVKSEFWAIGPQITANVVIKTSMAFRPDMFGEDNAEIADRTDHQDHKLSLA